MRRQNIGKHRKMALERLDKILNKCLPLSRSELKKAAKAGRIILNGNAVSDLSEKVDGNADIVLFDGKRVNTAEFVYIMLNKPKGVISASEGRGEKTVIDLLPEEMKRSGLFPAGRLDKDTTGFALITDDGELSHRILSPKNHIEKTYIATLDKPVDEAGIKQLENGITLNDGTEFLPAKIKTLNEQNTLVEVKICEGKYHEIKRMFASVGCAVTELERTAVGALPLDKSLKIGEARYITAEELDKITER